MPIVYTIGYTEKSLEEFVHLLEGARAEAVIDIRLRNTSQLAGFAKRHDLAFLLRTCLGIDYEHRLELAPTPELLTSYRATGDWQAYTRTYLDLLAERDALSVGRELLARYERPCLLCAEASPEHCHRRLVAEYWAAHWPNIEIRHLI